MASLNAKWLCEYRKGVVAAMMMVNSAAVLQCCGNCINAIAVKTEAEAVACCIYLEYRSIRWQGFCRYGNPQNVKKCREEVWDGADD